MTIPFFNAPIEASLAPAVFTTLARQIGVSDVASVSDIMGTANAIARRLGVTSSFGVSDPSNLEDVLNSLIALVNRGTRFVFTDTLTNPAGPWQGIGVREVINSNGLLPAKPSATSAIVTIQVQAGTAAGATLTRAFLGEGASSGNEYNFDGNQVPLLVSGIASFTFAGPFPQTVAFDATLFNYSAAKNLVVAIDFGSTGSVFCASQPNNVSAAYYAFPEGAGNQANLTTVTMSGPAGQTNPFVQSVQMV